MKRSAYVNKQGQIVQAEEAMWLQPEASSAVGRGLGKGVAETSVFVYLRGIYLPEEPTCFCPVSMLG